MGGSQGETLHGIHTSPLTHGTHTSHACRCWREESGAQVAFLGHRFAVPGAFSHLPPHTDQSYSAGGDSV